MMSSLQEQLSEVIRPIANVLGLNAALTEVSHRIDGLLVEGASLSELIRDLISESERPGSALTSSPINIIPGISKGHCHPVLVALASGNRGANGLDSILEKVKTHVVSCSGVTRLALVYTDYWDAKLYDSDHRATLEAISDKGTTIVYLLAPWKGSKTVMIGHHKP